MTEKVDRQLETQLQGAALWVARVIWVALVALTLGLFLDVSIQAAQTPVSICDTSDCSMSPALAATFRAAGISVNLVGLFNTVLFNIFLPLGFVVVALVIVWKRSDNWVGLLVSYLLVFLGAQEFPGVNLIFETVPVWGLVTTVQSTVALLVLVLLFYIFPDGRFVPRWGRWLMLAVFPVSVASVLLLPEGSDNALFTGLFFASALVGIGGQVYRYARISTPVERQQTKWALVGLIGPILTLVIWLTLVFPITTFPGWVQIVISLVITPLAALLALLMPATLAISILRYRLWDIDVVIRRTLIYGAVTGLLALVFFGGVAVLQSIFSTLTGARSSMAVVISTLAIAALFTPLRNRVQNFVDRRFYRRKYDAERTLETFSETMRDEVDLDRMTSELVNVVEKTIQPEHIALWLTFEPRRWSGKQ